jgi:hypothetical protein
VRPRILLLRAYQQSEWLRRRELGQQRSFGDGSSQYLLKSGMVDARARFVTLSRRSNMKSAFQIVVGIALAALLVIVGYLWGRQPSNSQDVSIKESVPVGFSGSGKMDFSPSQVPCSSNCKFRALVIKLPNLTSEGHCNTSTTTYLNCIVINDADVVDDSCNPKPCKMYKADVVLGWNKS